MDVIREAPGLRTSTQGFVAMSRHTFIRRPSIRIRNGARNSPRVKKSGATGKDWRRSMAFMSFSSYLTESRDWNGIPLSASGK